MDTPRQALEKLKHFCAYQERCHTEAREKLRQLGIRGGEADGILAALIEEGYLNEERYARSFARGHFRLKKWGKEKISRALASKEVSPYCIRRGLSEIPEDEYLDTLAALARGKYASLRDEQYLRRRFKTYQYLLSRGYEASLVREALETVSGD